MRNSEFQAPVRAAAALNGATVERIESPDSSWITDIMFLGTSFAFGYLVVRCVERNYVYNNVPTGVWLKFKAAPSFGAYFNRYIKPKYNCVLNY